MKSKKICIFIIVIIALILLVPIPMRLKDGGSVKFQALLYSVTKYHQLNHQVENGYVDGIGIEIFGVELINTADKKVETHTVTEERIKSEKSGEDEENNAQAYNSFVGTVLEETTTYMIVEPNEDEEERKSADQIRINYGVDHRDYLYGIGRKVVIQYTGYIKETYPAQIDTDNILTEGYEEFELSVKKSDNKTKTKILNNMELYKNNSDYDLYYYGLDEVNILVDNKTMSLEDALRSGKMTIDGILAKANKDVSDGKIKNAMYDDGGTTEWYYSDYTILKKHTLIGDRDVYILRNDITILDI